MKTLIFIFLTSFFVISCYAQESTLGVSDSLRFNYQSKFQDALDYLVNKKKVSLLEGPLLNTDILATKEDAVLIVKTIISRRFPELNEIDLQLPRIGEDLTSQMWFLHFELTRIGNARIFVIINKNTGQVVYFSGYI